MELTAYLDHLRSDGEALAAAAQKAPTAPIAACPDWDMTALLTHLGGIHHRVAHAVSTGATELVRSPPPDFAGPEAVLDWYQEGVAQLVTTLSGADPDTLVWNWFDQGPGPARFWWRRMAHETAVHRWDGEAAAGDPDPIATDLAVDGIDEFLIFVGLMLARHPVAGLEGSLHLHATDTDGEWSLDLWPDRMECRREHAKSDTAVRGPVSDLLLLMLNRVPADWPTLKVFGDGVILDRWRQLRF